MKEASEAFRSATEADPNYAEAFYQLGETLSSQAAFEGGEAVWVPGTKEAMEKYLQLDPNGPDAAAAKGLVDTITGGVTTSIGTQQ